MIVRKRTNHLSRKITLSLWAWWSLFWPTQGNFNLLSLLFYLSLLLSLSFLVFFCLPFSFFICLRGINSVFLTLYFTVFGIFPSIINDVNVCLSDENVFSLIIGNAVFFRVSILNTNSVSELFINVIFQVSFHSI